MICLPAKPRKDVIKNLLLDSDAPLSAEMIFYQWPTRRAPTISEVCQLLSRMKDVKKVGKTKVDGSGTRGAYYVDTWTHINHQSYSEWVDGDTSE